MRLKTYKYSATRGLEKIKTKTALLLSTAVLAVGGTGGMAALTFGTAHAATTTVNGCSFEDDGSTWTLQSDCTSSAEINVPANYTVDGAGHTISAGFTKTDNDNNSVLGIIGANNVTIENLTVDGSGGVNLHGINVYVATGVALNDVTLENNDHNGLVVNGAEVTVNNLTTSNNGWGGVDVDQGSGVTTSASLTVTGASHQNELGGVDIKVDDTTKSVTVNDVNHQYVVAHYGVTDVYTLKPIATSKDDCKAGGWQSLRADNGGAFKNQGACVSYVASNGKSQH